MTLRVERTQRANDLWGRDRRCVYLISNHELEASVIDDLLKLHAGMQRNNRMRWSGVLKSNTPRLVTTRRIS